MFDFHPVAATGAVPSDKCNHTVTYALNRSTRRRGIVNCSMGLDFSRDWMLASVAETAADPVVLERCLEKRLFETFSFLVPVFVSSVSLVEAYGCDLLGNIRVKYAKIDGINPYDFIVNQTLLINNPEPVSLLKREEIDAPGIDVRKF